MKLINVVNDTTLILYKHPFKVIWRLIIIGFSLLTILFFIYAMIVSRGNITEFFTHSEAIEHCEFHYYKGNYMDLLHALTLYATPDEAFDQYWEVAEAYEAYYQYNLWYEAYNAQDEGAEKEKYKQLAFKYATRVKDAYEACHYDENKVILENFSNACIYP